jgi:cytochrome bd ubiquinol oxidase subunit II
MTGLQVTWYVITAALVAGYAILDGFDLGIGMLYPLLGRDEERRAGLHEAVAPVWDGNEVWLILVGGALFAVFPPVYAAVLSGFYLVFMLVLFGLIFRAAALGLFYHGAPDSRRWVAAFSGGSFVSAFLLGLMAGNLIHGVQVSAGGDVVHGTGALFNPFAVVIGLVALAMFTNQGAAWAALKTRGKVRESAIRARWVSGWVLLGLVAGATLTAAFLAEAHFRALAARPLGLIAIALVVVGIGVQQTLGGLGHDRPAFLAASLSVAGLVGVWTVGSFPALVRASNGAAMSLTVASAAAPHGSLVAMTVVGGVGIPLVAVCLTLVYRVFRGKGEAVGKGY